MVFCYLNETNNNNNKQTHNTTDTNWKHSTENLNSLALVHTPHVHTQHTVYEQWKNRMKETKKRTERKPRELKTNTKWMTDDKKSLTCLCYKAIDFFCLHFYRNFWSCKHKRKMEIFFCHQTLIHCWEYFHVGLMHGFY